MTVVISAQVEKQTLHLVGHVGIARLAFNAVAVKMAKQKTSSDYL